MNTFGLWTVVDPTPTFSGKTAHRFLLCRCVCGFEKKVRVRHLETGASTRCRRCSQAGKTSALFRGHEGISSKKWKKLQADAATRGLPFEVSIEEAWLIFLAQGGRCALSGLAIEHARSHSSKNGTASFDRKDSRLGYVLGNVQWVHKEVNHMKGAMSEERLFELCRLIASHEVRREH